MRKIFGVLLSVLCICCAAIGLTGCKKDKHIHAFDKQVITDEYLAAPATCTEAATYYYSCSCGEKGTETFTSGNALGHSFTNYVSDNNATCTQDGTKTAVCDRDGCNAKDTVADEGSKLPHTFDKKVANEKYLASAATCTEAATYYYSCSCGEKGTQTFTSGNALGHSFTNYVSDNNATCTQDGTKTAVCDRDGCNAKDTVADEGSKLPHTFDKKVANEKYLASAATCTEAATYYYSCSCGEKGTQTFTSGNALGHSFTNYVSDNNATCTQDGTKTAKCDRCDKKNTVKDIDSKLNHSYTEQIVSDEYLAALATCNKKATYYYSCKCGATGIETFEYGSTTDHNFVNGRCTYCGKEQEASKGLAFTLLNDGTYEVSGIGACTDTEIVIPSVYNDKPVTVIGEHAFSGYNLTSVIMPNSIITIGDNAFDYCYYIETAIPENVVTIGDFAFYFCEMINTEIVIPKSAVSIGKGAFAGCTKVEKITVDNDNPVYYSDGNCIIEKASKTLISGCRNSIIPNGVISIADFAFESCFRLISVTIPDSVTTIGQSAFYWCQNLTSVVIGKSVKSIENYAFEFCYKIVEVINNSSLEITKGSKENGSVGCYALNVKKGGTTDIVNKDGYLFYTYEKVNYLIGYADTGLNKKSLILPESYNGKNYEIYQFAFNGYFNLTEVIIPDCVTSIGNYAFSHCSGLTSITIPDGVTYIGDDAFYNCSGLTSVTIPDSVTSIGSSAFEGCSGLTSVTIPDSVTSIGNYAFGGCYKLVEVINKSGLTITKGSNNNGDIAYYALNVKKDGTSDIVNKEGYLFYTYDNVNYLLAYVGWNTDLTLPDDYNGQNYKLNNYAFYNCSGLTSVTIPDSVTSIGESAFYDCSGLTSVTIPDSVTSIGESAFYDCSGLTSVTIGNSVTSIGNNAFSGCSGLTSVTIGNSVTSIGNNAFSGCSGLTSVTIGNSVTSIGNNAFSGCSGLTSVTIGNSVTSIGESAFYDCSGLTSVTIPDSVTSIGESAFYDCSGLTSVTIGNSVTSIGNKAFYDCSGLTSVTIPDSVTSIGWYAFSYCSGLTSVTIGNSVTSIGGAAFSGCSSLTSITIGSGVTSIGSSAFSGCSGLTSITIPDGVTSIGWYAFSGCSGLTSVTIPNSVTSIGERTFYDCSGLTSVTIPDSVTSIYNFAFQYCSGLTSITIPDSVTSIGGCAFYGCNGLTSVTIGNGVTTIGDSAFGGCSGIESLVVTTGNKKYHSANNCIIETETKKLIVGCKTSIIPSDDSVISIGGAAFEGCSGLTSITIPDGVTSIGDYAINGERDLSKTQQKTQNKTENSLQMIV